MQFKALMNEIRMAFDGGDAFGSIMNIWFSVAAEMYTRGLDMPDSWGYRPPNTTGDVRELGEYMPDLMVEASDDALLKLGKLCERYHSILERNGKTY